MVAGFVLNHKYMKVGTPSPTSQVEEKDEEQAPQKEEWESEEEVEEDIIGEVGDSGSRVKAAIAFDKALTEQFPDLSKEDVKMQLVVRNDLKMQKGKIGAQCGHAALGAFRRARDLAKEFTFMGNVMKEWNRDGLQKKVCLKIDSEAQLLELKAKVAEKQIPHYLVADAGLTQIKEGSLTVLGIGPAPAKLLAELTGHLKLL